MIPRLKLTSDNSSTSMVRIGHAMEGGGGEERVGREKGEGGRGWENGERGWSSVNQEIVHEEMMALFVP